MKKKLVSVLLLVVTLLTGCGAEASQVQNRASGEVTVEDIMQRYAVASAQGSVTDKETGEEVEETEIEEETEGKEEGKKETKRTQEIMPLYNMAEDQVFSFTFQADWMEVDMGELVTVHTDSKCEPESYVYTYRDYEIHDQGFTLSISPMDTLLETKYNKQESKENESIVWGNVPMYYIAIRYDMDSTEVKELEEPIIIPFTIKHEVDAPEVRGEVDANGCFSLVWEPVEDAEEYRIYQLVDGEVWTGRRNGPIGGAEKGYSDSTLLYVASTTDTEFADFGADGDDSLGLSEYAEDKFYCFGQNYSVCGEYYVSAVVDGKESGFARAIPTTDLQIPYYLTDESDIGYDHFETVEDLPLELDVVNIDGSITERNVYYTLTKKDTFLEGFQVQMYLYQVEGTMLSGLVKVDTEPEGGYPGIVGEKSTIGRVEPDSEVQRQPDVTVEPDIDIASLIQQQIEETRERQEDGITQSTEALDEKYMVFADSAAEEWLAINLINGENKISIEAFPELYRADNLEDTFYKVYHQNPYILGVTKFGYDYENMRMYVEYAYTPEEMEQMREEIYEEADSILDDIITKDMSDEEKRKAIYDYLEENCEYDYAALEDAEKNNFKKTGDGTYEYAFNTYGIIVKKVGVCQSFANAYKLLCNMSGVECRVMTGYLDGSLPHAWNAVKIDGEWYQTDSTNNANVCGIPYYLYNSDSETAEKTGFTPDEVFALDDDLDEYESTKQKYEYYYANDMYAEDLDEYAEVLDELLDEDAEFICVRYDGETPDQEDFEECVMEVFCDNDLEDKLFGMRYSIINNFILLTE